MFLVWYAGLFPIGIGIVYWPPILSALEWFSGSRGTINGLILSGFGFGAFIFGFISSALLNPDHIKSFHDGDMKIFPEDVAARVPYMFHICLIAWASLLVLGTLLVLRNPEFIRKEQETQLVNFISDSDVTWRQAIKQRRFWHISLMLFNGIFFPVYVASIYKEMDLDILDG